MRLVDAENLARKLIAKYLHDTEWKFSWNNRKKSFGVCSYQKKTIFLSAFLTVEETEDSIDQTIRHEIAHALVGSGEGHGPRWRQAARLIGVRNPSAKKRCSLPENERRVVGKWVMVFKDEIVQQYHRKPGQKTFDEIQRYYVRGRKAETQGKLIIMSVSEWERRI